MNKKTVGVVGIGEVGSAIAQIFSKNFKVLNRDLKFDEIKNSKIEVLHICLPYTDKFENTVLEQIFKGKPKLVIIHSTVKPGTTDRIFRKSKIPIVHSPVMGTHPNLEKDILRFTKIIGPVNEISKKLAKKHIESTGIKTITLKNSKESELGKILDTTYYIWNIIFAKEIYKICKDQKLDFKNVYTTFNKIYNDGYKITRPNVARPILVPQKGSIGGHCLIPNVIILDKFLKSEIASLILKFNKSYSRDD